MSTYLKVPCEMAVFALSERKDKQVRSYLASHFIYSGKAKVCEKPQNDIANLVGVRPRAVYRHLRWLLDRNWIGKDKDNGWIFFRGLDRIHKIEGWQFGRAAIMYRKDLQTMKAFLAGAVMASLAETGKGQRSEQVIPRSTARSEPPAAPISLSVISKALNISKTTAYRIRKMADDSNYINNEQNLVQITNWTPDDLTHLKEQDLHNVPVELLGYADKKVAAIDRIRYKNNKLYLQEPNMVKPLLHLKGRRGLSNYQPCKGYK